jgi:hypothetical protein
MDLAAVVDIGRFRKEPELEFALASAHDSAPAIGDSIAR